MFSRVYAGNLNTGDRIFNGRQMERVSKLYKPFADDYQEVQSIAAGDIGLIAGLKLTRTGDMLNYDKKFALVNDT